MILMSAKHEQTIKPKHERCSKICQAQQILMLSLNAKDQKDDAA